MSLKDDFLVDLEEEILTEAAHNLFSRRVRLEREVEAFSRAATRVRKQMDRTLQIADTVNRVVVEPERLYAALGVEPKGLMRKDQRSSAVRPLDIPFRFTMKGRYLALSESLYGELAAATETYNHGKLYRDPETTLMKRTAHYEELMEWHLELNGHIVTENKNRPSYALNLARSLNPDFCEKEKALEPCTWGNNGCGLDERLAFKGVPFSCTGLIQVPVLPPAREIKTRLHSFLEDIYDRHGERIHQLLLQKDPLSHTPVSQNQ
ncbi:MAG: hypothetical protein SWE60_21850 [Thermodesulfobacteriota bacterium]|nr:hypothetical protein [Thermodesulfobacteriota bacterium]